MTEQLDTQPDTEVPSLVELSQSHDELSRLVRSHITGHDERDRDMFAQIDKQNNALSELRLAVSTMPGDVARAVLEQSGIQTRVHLQTQSELTQIRSELQDIRGDMDQERQDRSIEAESLKRSISSLSIRDVGRTSGIAVAAGGGFGGFIISLAYAYALLRGAFPSLPDVPPPW